MGDNRYWLVWEDDSPIFPEQPLTLREAAAHFVRYAEQDPDAEVEIRQCTAEDLEWAGITPEADDDEEGDEQDEESAS